MVLRFAQNHKNNKFSFFIRKVNPYFELLLFYAQDGFDLINKLIIH